MKIRRNYYKSIQRRRRNYAMRQIRDVSIGNVLYYVSRCVHEVQPDLQIITFMVG